MLEIKKIKTENGELGISFVIQTSNIKQKYSDVVSVFYNAKERVEQRLRLFRVAWQVLRADPESVSLEKKGKENQLSFAWKDQPKNKTNNFDWKNFRTCSRNFPHLLETLRVKAIAMTRKAHLVVQSNKKKIVKVATGVSAITLIICASAILIPFINADELCPVDVDAILVIDTTASMADGSAVSKCEWTEERWDEESGSFTWFLNIKYDVSEHWCMNVRDDSDETSINYSYQGPIYTPAKNSKIDDAKLAAISFVGNLGTDDQSALVSFNTAADLDKELSGEHLGNTPSTTETAIKNLSSQPGTGTDIAGAIQAVIDEFDPIKSGRANPQAVKAAILLTDGTNQNIDDVSQEAQVAADSGYKIFTINLGGNANTAATLGYIANTTHAQYHPASHDAPPGSELALDTVYNRIANEICAYGSISGCKYLDVDADGEITEAEKSVAMPDWQIRLFDGSATTTQQTDATGCYTFAGLLAGNYSVSEILQTDWQQTYPNDLVEGSLEGSWIVDLNQGDNIIEKHFGNSRCGNGILDEGEECDGTNLNEQTCQGLDYNDGTLSCNIDCSFNIDMCTFCTDECLEGESGCEENTKWTCGETGDEDSCLDKIFTDCDDGDPYTTDACVDGECVYTPIDCNEDADCDDSNPCTDNICNLETYICESINNTNQCDDGDACTIDDICSGGKCIGAPIDCDDGDPCTTDACVDGECVYTPIVCDDGIECTEDSCVDGVCQYDDSNCPTEPEPTPPSGGGAVMIPHSILDVRPIDIVGDSVTITWRTSFFATSQIVYSIEGEIHNFDPDNPPLYGYAHMTPEQDTNPKVTFHTVVIPGLSPEQTYYYRTISRASPAVFSNEFTFTTLASLEEDDVFETDETQEQESATAEDSSDEFVPDESAASEELSLDEVEEKLNEISNKVATIGQEVAKISPRVNVPAFASVDSSAESLASNDLDSEADDEEPLFADATADKASFAEGTTNKVNNEINNESDDSKFLAGIGTFFSNLGGWRLALIFLLGIILALIILRLIKSLVGGNKNK